MPAIIVRHERSRRERYLRTLIKEAGENPARTRRCMRHTPPFFSVWSLPQAPSERRHWDILGRRTVFLEVRRLTCCTLADLPRDPGKPRVDAKIYERISCNERKNSKQEKDSPHCRCSDRADCGVCTDLYTDKTGDRAGAKTIQIEVVVSDTDTREYTLHTVQNTCGRVRRRKTDFWHGIGIWTFRHHRRRRDGG